MLNLNHKKLDVWKLSMEFIGEVYRLSNDFPRSENYGITNQMRRASVSISSNIAEGSSRKSSTERKRFYEIARPSLIEVDTQLEMSVLPGYLENKELEKVNELTNHLFAKITNLIIRT